MAYSITNCQIVLHLANLVTFDLRLTYDFVPFLYVVFCP
jgi:hypothetical protein